MIRVMLVWIVCMVVAGCAEGSSSHQIRHGTPPSQSPPGSNALIVRGIRVVPPKWLMSADEPSLAVMVDQYLTDFRLTFTTWEPQPPTAQRLPLMVVLHDQPGQDWWEELTRTAWLWWPRGKAGRPVRRAPVPLLHIIFVYDRRREFGISTSAGLTADESAAYQRGRFLPIDFQTNFSSMFE